MGPGNYFLVGGGDAQCHVDDARTSSEFMLRVNSVKVHFPASPTQLFFIGKGLRN